MRTPTLSLALALSLAACGDDERPGPGKTRVELIQYESCAELESDLEARAIEELEVILSQGYYGGGAVDDGAEGGAGAPGEGGDGDSGGGRNEGSDYSGTNNQEDGVDEADLVKTDGDRIFLVDGNGLHVFAVPEFGQLVARSVTPIEGQPQQLLLDRERGRAAVFSMVYVDQLPEAHPMRNRVGRTNDVDSSWFWRTAALSKLTLLDLGDPDQPALLREIWLEGWYQTARRTDSSVRMVVNGHISIPGLDHYWQFAYDENGSPRDPEIVKALVSAIIHGADLEELIPRAYVRTPDGALSVRSLAGDACRSFYRPTDSAGRATTSIVSLDLAAADPTIDADTVVSNWATVYASQERLYLAEGAWDWWWPVAELDAGELFTPASNIHAFDVSQAGTAAYVGSGRIDGTVINQFALDEQDGLLRVAATTTPWRVWSRDGGEQAPPPPPESHVYVLEEQDGALVTVGHLGGIEPGESIFSARFEGDKGYVVTFQQTDPLFTIDLSDPRSPELAGELEVFGFSTYLHPIEGDRLLAIGVSGDENGATWRTQVSMFDAADFSAPALLDREELVTEGYGWSEAQYEHKAFNYFPAKGLLAVPLTGYGETFADGVYTYEVSSTLELITVGEDGLARKGAIDHSAYYNTSPNEGYWTSPDVRRSIFMGDFIYALSARALTVHALADLAPVTALALPEPPQPYWWW